MKSWRIALIAASCALVLARPGRAEVRVVTDAQGTMTLDVHAVGGGVWTPVGRVDAAVVNPDGDRLHDGYPGAAVLGARELVAVWHRPSSHSLAAWMASGARRGFLEVPINSTPSDPPAVANLAGLALVAWSDEMVTRGILLDARGLACSETVLGEGRLMAVLPAQDSTTLVLQSPASDELVFVRVALSWIPNPIPVPEISLRVSLPRSGVAAMRGLGGQGVTRATSLCVGDGGDNEAALAWTSGDGLIGFVTMGSDGRVESPDSIDGPESGSCQAILNAVERGLAPE